MTIPAPTLRRAALALLLALVAFARPLGAQEVDWEAFSQVYQRATQAFTAGDLEAAEEGYLEAAEINPTAPESFFNLGLIEMQRERRHAAARRFRQALETHRRYPPARNQRAVRVANDRDAFSALVLIAGGMLQNSDAGTADSLLAYALGIVPHSRDALHYRAYALNAMLEWAELTDVATRLLEVDPLSEAGMTMLYNSYAGQAVNGMDRMATAAREVRDRMQQMPLIVSDLVVQPGDRQMTITGRVTGGTMEPGRRVRLTFTMTDEEGERVGSGTATVVAPARGQSVAFQLPVRTSRPAYAFRYEWR